MGIPDLSRLLVSLNQSNLQTTNNPLYQTVKQLIDFSKSIQDGLQKQIDSILKVTSGTPAGTGLANQTYLTSTPQTGTLPLSRELIAGTGITFNDSIAGQREVNSGSASGDYVVSSDGYVTSPSPINDGSGNFIYVLYTP